MYDEHYGLSGRPFQLTPDARFWFDTVTHRKAMAYLGYGLAQGEGFIVITGDIGAGKTTLVGHLMATIDKERLHAINIVSTQIQPDDLLRLVGNGLGMQTTGLSKAELLSGIERGLHATARGGRRTLLVIDEAQALPVSALEELRMLSNFQAGGHALLQIFLLGQPEFRDHLQASSGLEQLRQRVIAMHHLDPMGPEEVEPYMRHRLQLVGWNGNPAFASNAFEALYRGSAGVPRRLNQLAGRVMLAAAIEQASVIDAVLVEAVIADATGEARAPVAAVVEPVAVDAEARVNETVAPQEVDTTFAPEIETIEAPIEEVPTVDSSPVEPDATWEEIAPIEAVAFEPEKSATERVSKDEFVPNGAETDLTGRIAALEARVEDQDAALRRVLTLLVDWVEGDGRPDLSALHHAAG